MLDLPGIFNPRLYFFFEGTCIKCQGIKKITCTNQYLKKVFLTKNKKVLSYCKNIQPLLSPHSSPLNKIIKFPTVALFLATCPKLQEIHMRQLLEILTFLYNNSNWKRAQIKIYIWVNIPPITLFNKIWTILD